MIPLDTPPQRDLVLVGGGHAHAIALRRLAVRPIKGLRITLVSLASHTAYSGMLPGLVAGHYRFSDTHIDLRRLCQWAGVRFIEAQATGLNTQAKQLLLRDRPALGYDILSIDTGSTPELDSIPGAREYAIAVKPVYRFWQRFKALEQQLLRQTNAVSDIVMVGGGAGGVELILAMAQRLGKRNVRLHLLYAGEHILPQYHRTGRKAVEKALQKAGIVCHNNSRVSAVSPHRLTLESGRQQHFDHLFWCTGATGPLWLADAGLPLVEGGFLALEDSLQVQGHSDIFAAGDAATQRNHPRPKAGVYAVRQGPILADNLRRYALDKPLRQHRPQRRFLSLVSLGERAAVADRGFWSLHGKWVWHWKDRIDQQFMRRFSDLPQPMKRRYWGALPALSHHSEQPPCGGCGAKIGPLQLSNVLQDIGREFDAQAIAQAADDAVEITSASGAQSLWQSVDALRAIVDDPWLMGRISTIHALSDLYACGLRPHSALALPTLAFAAPALLERDLRQIIQGIVTELSAAQSVLLGGHSMQGAETAIGLSVNGHLPTQQHPLRKSALQQGDDLILTGSLGTGTLFAAHMQLAVSGQSIDHAINEMLQSNRQAAELARRHQVSAITDITGFGLAGHLLEMLGDRFTAELELCSIPVLPDALQTLAAGITSTAQIANRSAASDIACVEPDNPRYQLLFDPQTSGPLLLACPHTRSDALLQALHQCGYQQAEKIGSVCKRLHTSIVLYSDKGRMSQR